MKADGLRYVSRNAEDFSEVSSTAGPAYRQENWDGTDNRCKSESFPSAGLGGVFAQDGVQGCKKKIGVGY